MMYHKNLLPSALAQGFVNEGSILAMYVCTYVRMYVRTCRSLLGMSICGIAECQFEVTLRNRAHRNMHNLHEGVEAVHIWRSQVQKRVLNAADG